MSDLFVPVDPQDDYTKIVAEKFGDGENIDVRKLAKSKLESDRFIEQLKNELADLRSKVTTQVNAADLLTQLQNQRQVVPTDQQPPAPPPASQPTFDSTKAKEVFDELFTAKQQEERRKTNQNLVTETLTKKFGPDARTVLEDKAKELGVPLSYLAKIADENPKVFFRTIGIEDRPNAPPVVAPRPGSAPAQQAATGRDNAYWSKMKKDNPTFYFSGEARKQRYNDAMAGVYNP